MSNNEKFEYPSLNKSINNFKNLTDLEKSFFHIMHTTVGTGGCLLISGIPGIGKTAIIRNMAKVLDFQYIDIRLTQKDETEVGLFPKLDEIDNHDVVKEVPPYWAILSNQKPTIVAFEELNRARREIQNAALQILMEREIGHNFSFNDNVYFVATSNMEDSYIEDFSTAMRGRIIHYEYEFDYNYWYENYAKDNINKIILEWISANKFLLTEGPDDENDMTDSTLVSYLSPRSLSIFSKALSSIIKSENDIKTILSYTENMGSKFIGNRVYDLIEFLNKWTEVKINDVLYNFEKIKSKLFDLNREHILYLIDGCKSFVLNTNNKLNEIDVHKNIIKLLKLKNEKNFDIIDQDIIVGFLNFIIEHSDIENIFSEKNDEHIKILNLYKNNFSQELKIINKSKIDQLF